MGSDPKTTKFVYFDLETTGCPNSGSIFHEKHRIVQISAVCGTARFDATVNPECHIPVQSTAIHKITNEDVAGRPGFSKIFPMFRSFVKDGVKRTTTIVLVAHNAFGFDKYVLEKECSRCGLKIPPNWYFYDTLQVYREQFTELPSKKLGDIYKTRFNEDISNAHNSLADSLALERLFLRDIHQLFNLKDTVPANQQKYLPDEAPVINIRGIGQKTSKRISKVLNNDNPTIGDLRQMAAGLTYQELEFFVRREFGTFKESFVFSILCEITKCSTPHELFCQFPFIPHVFPSVLPDKAVKKLTNEGIRSPEQLKRVYLFDFAECGEKWDNLVAKLQVSPYVIGLMMRSV